MVVEEEEEEVTDDDTGATVVIDAAWDDAIDTSGCGDGPLQWAWVDAPTVDADGKGCVLLDSGGPSGACTEVVVTVVVVGAASAADATIAEWVACRV
ncbi:hypothetical protein PTSG_08379 [Salpingoeca rosetta]|uniref:Uncharacterized protein n=1 Tax=Salpingoeca rosetta (strain ATCC 50818 / BSB-021) TaxID=946362 RepID=F2UJI5_SALR5|nr:uncharacterized protein PTSG_08379 [Salpingoeca rosetta]EGD77284.1 hypothetical protein PTSG_08379 [Salpingoeca rosetta]|eukprot:XP_004990628.1 hypothetical protein PTSG_08379 [Salpingoeca rosetta]